MRLSTKVLNDVIPDFLRDGWQVVSQVVFLNTQTCVLTLILFQNVHAVGDQANAIILDLFESALQHTDVTAMRPRLEHAQIMRKNDMTRLGKLGGKSAGPIQDQRLVLINWAIQSSPVFNPPMREFETQRLPNDFLNSTLKM